MLAWRAIIEEVLVQSCVVFVLLSIDLYLLELIIINIISLGPPWLATFFVSDGNLDLVQLLVERNFHLDFPLTLLAIFNNVIELTFHAN